MQRLHYDSGTTLQHIEWGWARACLFAQLLRILNGTVDLALSPLLRGNDIIELHFPIRYQADGERMHDLFGISQGSRPRECCAAIICTINAMK